MFIPTELLLQMAAHSRKMIKIKLLSPRPGLTESYEMREIAEVRWIDGKDNPADALTAAAEKKDEPRKPLPKKKPGPRELAREANSAAETAAKAREADNARKEAEIEAVINDDVRNNKDKNGQPANDVFDLMRASQGSCWLGPGHLRP